eukprot:XP_025003740.1 protein FAM110B isoform X2 [Gallus gallus]
MPCRPRPKEQPRAGLRAQRPARHPHPRPRLGRTKAAVAAGPLRAARTRRGVSPHRSGLGGVGRAPRPGPRARPGPTRRRVGRKRRPRGRRPLGSTAPRLLPFAADPPPPPPPAGGGGGFLGPGSPLFLTASPRSSAGGSEPRRRRRQCCKEFWEFRGEETSLPLETFTTGEDLQTSQADIAGAQKFYIKPPLKLCSPPFRAQTSAALFQIAQRKQRDSHIFQREERRQWSRLIRTCVWWPCSTKAAFKREAQRYLMSCEMRRCC